MMLLVEACLVVARRCCVVTSSRQMGSTPIPPRVAVVSANSLYNTHDILAVLLLVLYTNHMKLPF